MEEHVPDVGVDALVRPVGMNAADEGRLQPPGRPVESYGCLPALTRGHGAEYGLLLRAERLVVDHAPDCASAFGGRQGASIITHRRTADLGPQAIRVDVAIADGMSGSGAAGAALVRRLPSRLAEAWDREQAAALSLDERLRIAETLRRRV